MRDVEPTPLVAYEWCVLRVVPLVERCEFVNAGVVVHCHSLQWLGAAVDLDVERARALAPGLDVEAALRHLSAAEAVCAGTHPATAGLSAGQRFRWLTAPRSTVVQASPVHTGLAADPAQALHRLLGSMVRVAPGRAGSPPAS